MASFLKDASGLNIEDEDGGVVNLSWEEVGALQFFLVDELEQLREVERAPGPLEQIEAGIRRAAAVELER